MTLDGVVESPQDWSFPYWSDETAEFKWDELLATDAHLLGRVTYEGFAAAWPDRTDAQGFADRMNSLPKYVVSTKLKKSRVEQLRHHQIECRQGSLQVKEPIRWGHFGRR